MKQITTIGLDLAKQIFQVHGADADGAPVVKPKAASRGGAEIFRKATFVPGRNRSLRAVPTTGRARSQPVVTMCD